MITVSVLQPRQDRFLAFFPIPKSYIYELHVLIYPWAFSLNLPAPAMLRKQDSLEGVYNKNIALRSLPKQQGQKVNMGCALFWCYFRRFFTHILQNVSKQSRQDINNPFVYSLESKRRNMRWRNLGLNFWALIYPPMSFFLSFFASDQRPSFKLFPFRSRSKQT